MANNNSYTVDAATQLKDAGLVAASAAAQVGGADKIVDLGAAYVEGVILLDVSAVEVASNDESYVVLLQGSNAAALTTPVNLAALVLGSAGGQDTEYGGGIATSAGRYYLRFQNEQNGTIYRYVRLYTTVAGTVATGINFTAWIGDTKSAS